MRTNSSFFLFFFEKALTLLTIKIIIENKFIFIDVFEVIVVVFD